MTSCPSARNRSQRCDPTNPAPPVMTVLTRALLLSVPAVVMPASDRRESGPIGHLERIAVLPRDPSRPGSGYSVIGRPWHEDLLEPEVAPRHPASSSATNSGSRPALPKYPSTTTGSNPSATMNWASVGIAAEVPLGRDVQGLGIDLAQDVAEVEVRVGDVLDLLAADLAEVALLALGHRHAPRDPVSGQHVPRSAPADPVA